MSDKPDHLKPVGGFAEVVGHLIPDLSLPLESDLLIKPTWQASIYMQFSDNDRLVSSLAKTIEEKLKGRLPMVSVGKGTDSYYLMALFIVEDNSELSEDLVDAFADGLHDAVSEASTIHDSRTDIDFVGDENEA